MSIKIFTLALFLVIAATLVKGQGVERPPVWGIARMTYLVSDFQIARDYYGQFLGFNEAFEYNSPSGKVIAFKINDRQFIEFIQDSDARSKPRLVAVSLETEDVNQMLRYLRSKEVETPPVVTSDGAGNTVFRVNDHSGVPVEFLMFGSNSLHSQSKGKFLSDERISKRIHHAGLYSTEVVDDNPFWVGILGCKEVWRFPEDRKQKVQMNYLQFSDCAEMIEHYPTNDVNFSHPCFLVVDMQETVYFLKERKGANKLGKPKVGSGKRWLLNMTNEDGIKVEFTEAHTVR